MTSHQHWKPLLGNVPVSLCSLARLISTTSPPSVEADTIPLASLVVELAYMYMLFIHQLAKQSNFSNNGAMVIDLARLSVAKMMQATVLVW